MIQAYIDESGVMGTDSVFVMAGFIARAEDWANFSSEWKSYLATEPSIRFLKMNDAVRRQGEFYGWSQPERDAKLQGFVAIMKRYPFRAIHYVVDLDAYTSMKFPKPMKDPYYMGFNTIVAGICYDVLENGVDEEIEIIFDEHVIFSPRVALWYPALREGCKHRRTLIYRL